MTNINKNKLTPEQIEQLENMKPEMSRDDLKEEINRLNLSAEDKGLLWSLRNASINVGSQVIRAGAWLVEVVCRGIKMCMDRFPNTSAAIAISVVIYTLMSMFPIIGWMMNLVFAPIMIPLLIAPGLLADLTMQFSQVVNFQALSAWFERVQATAEASTATA